MSREGAAHGREAGRERLRRARGAHQRELGRAWRWAVQHSQSPTAAGHARLPTARYGGRRGSWLPDVVDGGRTMTRTAGLVGVSSRCVGTSGLPATGGSQDESRANRGTAWEEVRRAVARGPRRQQRGKMEYEGADEGVERAVSERGGARRIRRPITVSTKRQIAGCGTPERRRASATARSAVEVAGDERVGGRVFGRSRGSRPAAAA